MLALPQELLEMTIDHLHDHKLSLLSCSLVCHAWVNASRHHLFDSIRVWIVAKDETHKFSLPLFANFLGEAPSCTKLIRTLCIVEYFPAWWGIDDAACDVSAVYTVVQLLPRLLSLVLDGVLITSSDASFVRNAPPRHIRTLSLIKADITPQGFVELNTILPATHAIQVLGSPQSIYPVSSSTLQQTVSFHNTSFIIRGAHLPAINDIPYFTLVKHQPISHITHLDITLSTYEFGRQIEALNDFLTCHGSILSYLRVDYHECYILEEFSQSVVSGHVRLKLESCPVLASYAVRLCAHHTNETQCLRQWRHTIHQLKYLPVAVREVTFGLDDDDAKYEAYIPKDTPWSHMDTEFKRLKNLVAVKFQLELANVDEPWLIKNLPFWEHRRDLIHTQLPSVVSRGLLEFAC